MDLPRSGKGLGSEWRIAWDPNCSAYLGLQSQAGMLSTRYLALVTYLAHAFLSSEFPPTFSQWWLEEPGDAFRLLFSEHLSLPLRHHWPHQERTLDSEETSPEIGLIQLDVPSQHPVFLEWKAYGDACVLMSQRREFTRAKGQARDQSRKSDGRCQAPVRIWGQPWLWVYSARHVRLPWSQLITAKDTLMPAYCSLCFYGNGLNELMSFTTTAECLVRELLMTMAVSLLCLVHCLGTLQDYDTCLFLIRQFHSLRAKSRCVQSFCLPFEGHASSYDHLFSLVLTISLSHSTGFFFFFTVTDYT